MIYNKQVTIIGGGPGGLTLARLLQLKGVNVKVYERDADRFGRQQGTTLDLHEESGLRALEVAGLMDAFKANYRPGADKMLITDKDATVLYNDHDDKPLNDFGGKYFRPEIDRGPLRDMLIDSLQPGTITWDAQFIKMAPQNEGWQLYFGNGTTAYADVVIGVDGANSKMRPYVTDIQPIYSGVTMIEGNIYRAETNAPVLNKLVKGGKIFALGDEKSLILSAKGDGTLSFCTGTKEDEFWVRDCGMDFTDRLQLLDWFKQRYGDWSPIWQELFGSNESYFVPRPMYHFPLNQHWETQANLTIIGDAAHRMPPYAGEGVNMAMQDALELYEALCESNFTDLQTAIHHFETNMLARAAEVTQLTLQQTESMHGKDGLEQLVGMFKEFEEQG